MNGLLVAAVSALAPSAGQSNAGAEGETTFDEVGVVRSIDDGKRLLVQLRFTTTAPADSKVSYQTVAMKGHKGRRSR